MSRIYERRKSLRLSQAAVAKRTGIPQTSISHYELGREMSASVAAQFARGLECSSDYLLGLTDDPTPAHAPPVLTPEEEAIFFALRSGDKLRAIRLISGDE